MNRNLRIAHIVGGASAACRALAGPHLLTMREIGDAAVSHVVFAAENSGGMDFAVDAFCSAAGGMVRRCRASELLSHVLALRPHIVQCWGCAVDAAAVSGTQLIRLVYDVAGDGDSLVVPRCDSPREWSEPLGGVIVTECSSRRRTARNRSGIDEHRVIRSGLRACGEIASLRLSRRSSMKIGATQCALLVLPPADAASDGFTAVWASLLVAQIHSHVRIIIPTIGAHGDRLRALVRSTKFEHLLTPAESASDWLGLMAAADIGIQFRSPLSGANGIAEMLSMGRRVVALDEPAARELAGESPAAYFASAAHPKPAAAALLRAVDDWTTNAGVEVRPQSDLVSEYERLYADLLGGKGRESDRVAG